MAREMVITNYSAN